MKKIITIFVICCVASLLSGCDNFLFQSRKEKVTIYPLWKIDGNIETGGTIIFHILVKANRVFVELSNSISVLPGLPISSSKCEINDKYNWICYNVNDNYYVRMIDGKYADIYHLNGIDGLEYVSWWRWYFYRSKEIVAENIDSILRVIILTAFMILANLYKKFQKKISWPTLEQNSKWLD